MMYNDKVFCVHRQISQKKAPNTIKYWGLKADSSSNSRTAAVRNKEENFCRVAEGKLRVSR